MNDGSQLPSHPRALASGGEGSGVGGHYDFAAPPTPYPSPPFAVRMGGGGPKPSIPALTALAPYILVTGLVASPAARADVADFYRGKNLRILVGYGTGAGYDVYARLLGRHIARYIPGQPSIVIQNMPGAASMT